MKAKNRQKLIRVHDMLDTILLYQNGLPDEGTPPVEELTYDAIILMNEVFDSEPLFEQLKPCPFCGGEAAVGSYRNYSSDNNHWVICCTECEIGLREDDTYKTKEQAIAAWNRRVEVKE